MAFFALHRGDRGRTYRYRKMDNNMYEDISVSMINKKVENEKVLWHIKYKTKNSSTFPTATTINMLSFAYSRKIQQILIKNKIKIYFV